MRAVLFASLFCVAAAYSGLRAQTLAAPAPAEAGAPGAPGPAPEPEIQYEHKDFEEDWGNEWKHGDFPSYKKTYSEDTFPGRAAVVAAEDIQTMTMFIPVCKGLLGSFLVCFSSLIALSFESE